MFLKLCGRCCRYFRSKPRSASW